MPTSHRNASFDAYSDGIAPFAQPVFAHLRDLCVFAAYRNHCAVTFYKDALMTDSRLLANSGLPAAKRFLGRLTGLADLPPCGDLTEWISEAMVLNGQGIKLPSRDPKTPKEVEVPAAFATQLEVLPYRRGPVMDRRGQAAVLEICQAGLTSGRLIWRPELGKFW